MKKVMVTGGAGFIGSNFIRYMLNIHNDIRILNVDALTYAGRLGNLTDVAGHPYYTFVNADIRCKEKMEDMFAAYDIDTVVNFAAESHVDRSIKTPEVFLETNTLGTQVLLECAKKHWSDSANGYRSDVRFVQISTDEVYGALGAQGRFTEDSPLCPNSPYSASKAGADLIVRAYYQTYGLPVCITRCSNNYGPWQFPEKLIPLMILNCLQNKPLPVYGDGKQVRDWLHVSDHCRAIEVVLRQGRFGEIYNIGGDNERANIDIVNMIIDILDKPKSLIKYVKDRPGHDRRYAINHSKITHELGWKPHIPFVKGIRQTIEWYKQISTS